MVVNALCDHAGLERWLTNTAKPLILRVVWLNRRSIVGVRRMTPQDWRISRYPNVAAKTHIKKGPLRYICRHENLSAWGSRRPSRFDHSAIYDVLDPLL